MKVFLKIENTDKILKKNVRKSFKKRKNMTLAGIKKA